MPTLLSARYCIVIKGNMAYRDTIHFKSNLTKHQIIYNYYYHTKSMGKIWGTICLNRVRWGLQLIFMEMCSHPIRC